MEGDVRVCASVYTCVGCVHATRLHLGGLRSEDLHVELGPQPLHLFVRIQARGQRARRRRVSRPTVEHHAHHAPPNPHPQYSRQRKATQSNAPCRPRSWRRAGGPAAPRASGPAGRRSRAARCGAAAAGAAAGRPPGAAPASGRRRRPCPSVWCVPCGGLDGMGFELGERESAGGGDGHGLARLTDLLLQVVRPVPGHLEVRPDHPVRRALLLLLLRRRPGPLPAGRVGLLWVCRRGGCGLSVMRMQHVRKRWRGDDCCPPRPTHSIHPRRTVARVVELDEAVVLLLHFLLRLSQLHVRALPVVCRSCPPALVVGCSRCWCHNVAPVGCVGSGSILHQRQAT